MVEHERLTARQAASLREELEELEGPRRAEVVAAIKKAREFGDLSENFEYHAAKNEQGLLEARIRTLRARLDGAEIVEDAASDEVGIGSVERVSARRMASRCTCVSTTTPSAMPNAVPSTTLAVLRATPRSFSSSSIVRGTFPPKSFSIICAAALMDFAFAL